MKWYFLFWVVGLSLSEPYNTEAECVAALERRLENPYADIIDSGFYGNSLKPGGICLQGVLRP